MKIEAQSLKDEPIEVEEDIPAANWQMDSFDVKFVNDIHLGCKFSRVGKEIIVNGEVTAQRLITCSRCLEEAYQTTRYAFNLNYDLSKLGDYLDIDKDAREEILLNFPMKVLCRQDCQGLCPGCGVNLNHQQCQCHKN